MSTQAELTALNNASTKSTKLLSEKLALAHELASLKPELEHLQAQASEYQTTLSEKLALQRELSTLEVELENQKRSAQRLQAKQSEDAAQDQKFEAQVAKLQKELTKEKDARERSEKEAQKALEDEQGKRIAMETKLGTTKDKLRQLKAYLKEQEVEMRQLKASEAASSVAAGAAAAQLAANAETERPKKRQRKPKQVMIEPKALGTPNNDAGKAKGAAGKANKRVSTLPGDKSTFSITPFLNRTASLGVEILGASGPADDEPEGGSPKPENPKPAEIEADATAEPMTSAAPSKKRTKKAAAALALDGEGGAPPAKKEKKPRGKAAESKKRAAAAPALQVVEEREETEGDAGTEAGTENAQDKISGQQTEKSGFSISAAPAEPERKGKKRKLLGSGAAKTVFDEDEAGPARPLIKSLFGGGNRLPALSGGLAGKKSALAVPFSPLKKDKRASSIASSILQ